MRRDPSRTKEALWLAGFLLLTPLTAAWLMQFTYGVLPWQRSLPATLANALCLALLYWPLCALTGRAAPCCIGVHLAAVWAAQLQLPPAWRQAGCMTARLHMKAGRYGELRAATRYDLLREIAASPCASAFWQVVDADSRQAVSVQARRDWHRICELPLEGLSEERARQLAISCLTANPAEPVSTSPK